MAVGYLCWTFIAVCQTVIRWIKGNFDEFNMNYILTILLIALTIPIFLYTVFLNEFVHEYNQFLLYCASLQRDFMPKSYDPNKSFANMVIDFGAAVILAGLVILTLLTGCLIILYPRLPFLIGSIIPEKFFILPVRLIVTPVQIYLCVCVYCTAILAVTSIYYYFCLMTPFVSQELRMDRKKYKTSDNLRTPKNLIKVYRTVQLLNIEAMFCCGPFIVPQQILLSKFIVFNNYMQILYSQQMSWVTASLLGFWAFAFTLYWTIVLSFGGYLYYHTHKVLLSWKCHGWNCRADSKLMAKFRKSCTPITVHHGKTFVIRPLTVLKFIRGLTVGTFRALLIGGRH
ncbi:unnamed protein product [Orchesella dallaii]|uniref:Odorant receptor n=1 Tax=Orchesella dallaii TaxID=48710 RepID=A0ABP1PLQ2_9HEXA